MIGLGGVVVQRGYSPRLFAGILVLSSLFALSSTLWIQGKTVAQQSFLINYAQAIPQTIPQTIPKKTQVNVEQVTQRNSSAPVAMLLPAGSPKDDPLNSPYPLPWSMIWEQQTLATERNRPVTLRYFTAGLRSPNGQLIAHSEIEVQLSPDFRQSHIFSQLIVKTAQGKVVQSIPSSMHLGQGPVKETSARQLRGTIAMLLPAAWSASGKKLLSRQFEAVFGSDVSSDYAVIWHSDQLRTKTITPLPINYDSATLLGWSQSNPEQVLFRTSILGEPQGTTLAVDLQGSPVIASPKYPASDSSLTPFGQIPSFSEKPQAHR